MSVICQNFVQNAWKKDLCSNCFKSVGDHGIIESLSDSESFIESRNENLNERYISRSTDAFHSLESSTPHTTWKTLISEKNGRHNKPFNLETGFQGRLLTINKATNGTDKNSVKEINLKNGLKSKNGVDNDETKPVNGHAKSTLDELPSETNGNHTNEKEKCPEKESTLDERRIKLNGLSAKSDMRSTPDIHIRLKGAKCKVTKSNSEESPPKRLHGILKKTCSSPVITNLTHSQGRRNSNVGFKDEQPMVIGYGGRDFSPEEMEWDMNTSDTEHGSDSLDETEDDKAFSKMTRQNTEFNSDNTNLLKKEAQSKANGNDATVASNRVSTNYIDTKNITSSDLTFNNHVEGSSKKSKGNDGVSSGEMTVSGESLREGTRAKINLSGASEDLPLSGVSSVHNGSHLKEMEDGGRLAVKKEMILDESILKNDNSEWQEKSDVAGEILQAINTSLANRHETSISNVECITIEGNINENENQPKNGDDKHTGEVIENVEPRASFLHGIKTTITTTKPSAIYGPASDLFVSRSNSSSSSSSDELGKGNASITCGINVIMNGAKDSNIAVQNTIKTENEFLNENTLNNCNGNTRAMYKKAKPKIPAKPAKQLKAHLKKYDIKSKSLDSIHQLDDVSKNVEQSEYNYSIGSASPSNVKRTITLIDHYAESNIYEKVPDDNARVDNQLSEKGEPRQSKLAALALELEQVRQPTSNTKRQAPAPPKIPEPPSEDPPTCYGRISPTNYDPPLGFSSYRGEALGFSSSSSAASTSSQDTEAGYGSWTVQGGSEDQRKQNKSKSSFLMMQYSKCKMLAKEYAEDSAKSRKKFSIKKLLKIGKESDAQVVFDPSCPNPKAWKYNDQFDRPRAKLEIIHPMDLEDKTVTINPGFESFHSLSSFTVGSEDFSHRSSVSSDYGSFYSDTMSPNQDNKLESGYDCIEPNALTSEEQVDKNKISACSSNSPTPSRASLVSQASTLTSGSSKNGSSSPYRPPKPPPPPRAHSLVPGCKTLNSDGTYKFPVSNTVHKLDVSSTPPARPEAPRRQCKTAIQRLDEGIYDNTGPMSMALYSKQIDHDDYEKNENLENDVYGTVIDVCSSTSEPLENDVLLKINSLPVKTEVESQVSVLAVNSEAQSINVTVKAITCESDKPSRSTLSRNKNLPITKAPNRPPPIYMKPQMVSSAKNPHPWKTLEDSYSVLTSFNRELLSKLVNKALQKRKQSLKQLQSTKFQWAEFNIDAAQSSSIFAFGEKIAYNATTKSTPEDLVTLVVAPQQSQNGYSENTELKYPVIGQFTDYIPSDLLDNSTEIELDSTLASVLVLDRSNISPIEFFAENLPESLSEEEEKEICFILLQLINSLKSLQAQGVESIESSFQNLVLAKTADDKYNTLVFLSDGADVNDYMADSDKSSLCQYALLLLFQLLGVQSMEKFGTVSPSRFSSLLAHKLFEVAIALLAEEKAVSLSQTKTLLECFLYDVTKAVEKLDESECVDNILHRWLDIKRASFIRNIVDDAMCDITINVQNEYYSQFLARASVRNMKDVISFL